MPEYESDPGAVLQSIVASPTQRSAHYRRQEFLSLAITMLGVSLFLSIGMTWAKQDPTTILLTLLTVSALMTTFFSYLLRASRIVRVTVDVPSGVYIDTRSKKHLVRWGSIQRFIVYTSINGEPIGCDLLVTPFKRRCRLLYLEGIADTVQMIERHLKSSGASQRVTERSLHRADRIRRLTIPVVGSFLALVGGVLLASVDSMLS